VEELTIPVLLHAEEVAVSSYTINGLQQWTDTKEIFCKIYSLKCILKETKERVFKKGRKIK
jgi:hypothetical protein